MPFVVCQQHYAEITGRFFPDDDDPTTKPEWEEIVEEQPEDVECKNETHKIMRISSS